MRALLSTITVINDNDGGSGSLRAALGSAVAGDTIKFAPSAYGTITLSSGPLDVTTSVTIDGPGWDKVAINGNDTYQDLVVDANVTATISGLTITGGAGPGGYFVGGGGIDNLGTLTVQDCMITGNSAAAGGGIGNSGSLTVAGCSVTDNSAGFGGGINNHKGGVIEISGSRIANNSATDNGGGIYNQDTLTADDCVITGNSAGQFGGGIGSTAISGPAPVTITNCVISDNTAAANAGGLDIQNLSYSVNNVKATISGSTFENNAAGALDPFGGAITVYGSANVAITGSLFQFNAAVASQQGIGPLGGAVAAIFGESGNLDIANCRFVGNAAVGWPATSQDVNGGAVYVSSAFNVQVTGSSFTDNVASGGVFVQGGALDLVNDGFENQTTLSGDTFQGNMAVIDPTSSSAGSAEGGALVIGNPTTVSGCTFTGNQAIGGPGGGFGLGGAVQGVTYSGLDLTGCQFIDNSAIGGPGSASVESGGYGAGGGLNIEFGNATVSNSTFVGNQALGGTQVPSVFTYGGAWAGASITVEPSP